MSVRRIDERLTSGRPNFGLRNVGVADLSQLVLIRIEVLHGNIRKVRKAFWEYVNDVLADYSLRHKWHVLEGIATKQHSDEWVLLVPSKRRNIENGKKESG